MATIMQRARAAADATPADRDRVVDALRVGSMAVVVLGHWLMAIAWASPDGLVTGTALDDSTVLQLATWLLQVMPLFFLAGGFSNGRSLDGHDGPLGTWLAARGRRLLTPIVPVVGVWAFLTLVASPFVEPGVLRTATLVALVPLWFLAVYLGIVLLAPLTRRLWHRWGWWSVAAGAAGAIAVDALRFGLEWRWIGWVNFAFVWATVHQAGYGWRSVRTPGVGRVLAPVGLALLVALVAVGPYPISMIGLDGQTVTNTTPPTFALLALAAFQTGLVGLAAPRLEHALARPDGWTKVVLAGGMAMTWYAWHLTVMVLVIGADLAAGGVITSVEPFTEAWWLSRPLWAAGLGALTVPVVLGALRFEHAGKRRGSARPTWVVVAGLVVALASIAWLVLSGLGPVPVVAFTVGTWAVGALRVPAR